MRNLFFIVILLYCYIVLNTTKVFAAIHLNEIYPAPQTGDSEWIELYNDENTSLDITNYYLIDLANNKIKLATDSAQPLGFIIATSSSILNNNGDTVFLKNNLNETLEVASYSGSFDSTKSYSRCPDGIGDWFSSNIITKNASNYPACIILTPTLTPTLEPTLTPETSGRINPSPTETQTPTPIPQSYDNIFISEVMIDPETGNKEWVEIYNDNDFLASLTNWYFDDIENAGSSPKSFSLEIPAKSYRAFNLSSSMFNNDGDSVRLLDFDKNLKDSFEYSSSTQGKTWGRVSFDKDDFCLQEPSYEAANNNCLNPTPTITLTPKPTPTLKLLTPSPFKIISPNSVQSINQLDSKNDQVLGASTENIFSKTLNNRSINYLLFISFSYSLLTLLSILFKMKSIYGKNKKFLPSLLSSP